MNMIAKRYDAYKKQVSSRRTSMMKIFDLLIHLLKSTRKYIFFRVRFWRFNLVYGILHLSANSFHR